MNATEWPLEVDNVVAEDLDHVVHSCEGDLARIAGKSLLLTGGTGFIGRNLVETLLRCNQLNTGPPSSLTLVSRDPQVLASRYPRQIASGEVSVTDWSGAASRTFESQRWDYVVHAASPADPREVMRDPDSSLRDIIASASAIAAIAKTSSPARAILISSGAVYGEPPADLPEIPEEYGGAPDVSRLSSVYGEGKRISELLFRASGVDQRVARVFSLTGPYQDVHGSFAVPDLIRQASETRRLDLVGDGRSVRSYCYSSDLTIFLVRLLLGAPRHETYNVGSREGIATIGDVAHTLSSIFGGLEVTIQAKVGGRADIASRYVPRLDRMDELHQSTTSLWDGLVRTCHSLYSRGLIQERPVIDLSESKIGKAHAGFN